MKVTAIERVSATRPSASQERANTPLQRVAHLASETADSASTDSAGSRHIPVLPVSNNTTLRAADDATLAYAQRKESQPRQGQALDTTALFAPLPAHASAAQALNQVYGGTDAPASESSTNLNTKTNATASGQAAEPPKEPISKQLMELVTKLWAASRAAVDAAHPPEPTPAPPPAQSADDPARGLALNMGVPGGMDRRQRSGTPDEAASAATLTPLTQTYSTRARRNRVKREA